jgi:4-hydroxybenzoate polyprenyltransferase
MKSAVIFVIISSLVFIFAAAMISKICFLLSFPVLLILFSYSYTKRFTSLSHLYLGLSISLAPLGTWIAVTGRFDLPITVLSIALLTYIAGFDILYACQDVDFDKKMGLFSIPVKLGIAPALHISSALHVVSFLCLFLLLILFDLGIIYMITLLIIGGLFILEHQFVKPGDLTHIQKAFFNVNSVISIILFIGILGDELIRKYL